MTDRPLSPHLSHYRPEITSSLSILHRVSGIVLALGALVLSWWIVSVALGGVPQDWTARAFASVVGRIALFGWTLAFCYHLANGIRHLTWDAGYGFSMPVVRRSGWTVVVLTVILSVIIWLPIIF